MTVFATFAKKKTHFPMLFHTVANNVRVNVLTKHYVRPIVSTNNNNNKYTLLRITRYNKNAERKKKYTNRARIN